ncbi:hypothetical protein AB3S75_047164 [Citrus x aurantiifolia]
MVDQNVYLSTSLRWTNMIVKLAQHIPGPRMITITQKTVRHASKFFKLIKNSSRVLIAKTKGEANDEESPECNRSINLSKNDDKDGQFFPPNYAACVHFFWLLMKALLIVLGLGNWRIKIITEKKETTHMGLSSHE